MADLQKITSHKVGLALGGGAARGLAHIGVLKVLAKYNVPVHAVAGTSMGAVVGAFYAAGLNLPTIEEAGYRANWLEFYDPILPKEGLSGGDKVIGFIESYIGPVIFKNLPIPLTVAATDMDTGKEVAISTGKVASAVQASAALPGFFVPPTRKGIRLMDGGLVNPLPVNHLVQKECNYIIAVDVQSKSMGTSIKDSPEAILRAFDIMQQPLVKASCQLANVVIRPEIGKIYPLHFNEETELFIRAGEEATEKAINKILHHLSLNPGTSPEAGRGAEL